jgi:predicted aspartyl protease
MLALILSATLAAAGEIPFELHLDAYPLVTCEIDGHPVRLVLDTAAAMSVLDDDVLRDARIDRRRGVHVLGGGGARRARLTETFALSCGEVDAGRARAVSVELERIASRLGAPIDGVLAASDLHRGGLAITWRDATIRPLDASGSAGDPAEPPARRVPLVDQRDGRPAIEVRAGETTLTLLIDTASPHALKLTRRGAEHAGLDLTRARHVERLGGGLGGDALELVATLPHIELAGLSFENTPAVFPVVPDDHASDDVHGSIGMPLLRRFDLALDLERRELRLRPVADATTRPFWRNRLGLQMEWSERVARALFVSPGSPAERAGLERGMRLAAIDDVTLTADTWAETWRAAAGGAAGRVVEIEDRHGERHRATLADTWRRDE